MKVGQELECRLPARLIGISRNGRPIRILVRKRFRLDAERHQHLVLAEQDMENDSIYAEPLQRISGENLLQRGGA